MSLAGTVNASLVIDASVAMKWLVDEDGSDAAFTLRDRDLAAPMLLRIEAANVLRTLVARQAATPDEALDLFVLLQNAPVTIVDHDEALESFHEGCGASNCYNENIINSEIIYQAATSAL
ncbi:type II toxin-antitoxin system VapC family toxin [Paracoccus sp. MC1862]|uniref:type II toxin-antitoxin system VapC family toxin n=1 Tax=Paracoccus sp. MC1862 TaxID=2760307 RepID=UPI0015FF008D|nr:type II toxin-antitoxin system VapC family toxin [Paracoccus sp. MC1862]MBB1498933.1 type II toxin-antitoxin system VapC family toxin [Paracoccus sp. MC1862]QQO46729.1 type II toxin-antitoxin system VapC family toxin [Paracoccus sp. MC1862]